MVAIQLIHIMIALLPIQTAPSVTVVVREAAEVGGANFTLGEIADITGADKDLAARVAAVQVGASPLPGFSRGLWRSDIITRLLFNQLDPKRIDVQFPLKIRITRVSH